MALLFAGVPDALMIGTSDVLVVQAFEMHTCVLLHFGLSYVQPAFVLQMPVAFTLVSHVCVESQSEGVMAQPGLVVHTPSSFAFVESYLQSSLPGMQLIVP